MTQNDQIKAHLDAGKSITPIEALTAYGIMRLASRISDLKRSGYPIITEIVKRENDGKTIKFARYRKG